MAEGRPRPPMVFDRAFLTGVSGVTQLIFIRHGEQQHPDYENGSPGAAVDPPLSGRGQQQARLVGERFSTEMIDTVYASPLQRAYDTAMEVARHHRLTPIVANDLREIEVFRDVPADQNLIQFVGRNVLAGTYARMLRERKWDVYPYSESSFGFRKRVVNAVEAIIAENEGRRVAIACHGGVINAYIAHIIGVEADMFFRPAHTSVSIVYSGEGIRALQSLNDVNHLTTPEGSFLSH